MSYQKNRFSSERFSYFINSDIFRHNKDTTIQFTTVTEVPTVGNFLVEHDEENVTQWYYIFALGEVYYVSRKFIDGCLEGFGSSVLDLTIKLDNEILMDLSWD